MDLLLLVVYRAHRRDHYGIHRHLGQREGYRKNRHLQGGRAEGDRDADEREEGRGED